MFFFGASVNLNLMDSNNWRPNQGQGTTEPTVDTNEWRAAMLPESRQRIINKIMETLKKHFPVSGPDGLLEVRKIAQRFEEKIFAAATSQADYLRKISLKMLAMESKTQNSAANNMPSNQVGSSSNQAEQGLALQQPQAHNPGQQHGNNLASQPQPRQQLLSQSIQSNVAPQPNLSSVSTLAQTPSQNSGQSTNTHSIPGQNSVGSTIGLNSNIQNMFSGSQRQMPGRQQVVAQQQQQQSQNPQQIHYQQQQMLKHKLQMSQMQQQQQQQNPLQPNQLQSSQQSVMQTSLSGLPQNQQSNNVQQSTQSMLQQHSQVMRHQQQQASIAHQQQQASIAHQQQTSMGQQPILPSQQQQQQQLMGPQSNATNVQQHAHMLGTQNNTGDIHQQRLLSQQSNMNLPQRHHLMNQQNNLTNTHQQQLGNNVPGLQQQQLFGTESSNQGMQTSHHSSHMLQQPKVSMQQQSQQNASNMLPSHSQQSQPQASQHQLLPQMHTQTTQLQQQLGLQQQPSLLQRDMQHKLQTLGPLHQQQNIIDQQKQLYKTQRVLADASTTSADSTGQSAQTTGVDWQEESYQKIVSMKEKYLTDLKEIYQRIAMRIQQHDSASQQPKLDHLEKLRAYKAMLERLIPLLEVSKKNILPNLRDKLDFYEKQIITLLNSVKPRRNISSLQQGQLPAVNMPSMAQSQSQVTSVQSHPNQMNSQMSSNLQSSAATMQQNNIASLQNNSMSSLSTGKQNMLNSMQPGTNLDSGQGNSVNSLQQVPVSSLQQNSVSTPQQTNINSLPSQGGVNVIQPNPNTLQSGSTMLQQQLKHQQEQQMLQNQPFKQHYQQRQLMQKQQILQQQQKQQQQQLHQPAKQQLSAQLHTHQMPQLHQMNDDVKMRQGMGVKPGIFQQHLSSSQPSAYSHQQLKQGVPFLASSPQLVQAASPQISQHSSPQVDQQNHLMSLTKVATPLQSSNSPFVGPTPSPPMAPSPMPGDSDKSVPGVLSISNAPNVGQHTGGAAAPAQSLAIGTPGISASPLLAEFSGPDGAPGNALASTPGKSTTEKPIDRLIRAVSSMSTKALNAAAIEMRAVISMNDRIAGSAPGNGSRAAVGEDLASMTNCRHEARNFSSQDPINGTRKIKRYIRARPINVVSSVGSMNDNMNLSSGSEAPEMESTATSNVKKPKIEVHHALLEEIKEINFRLIDTIVEASDEAVDPSAVSAAAEGTVVKCSFNPVALSPSLKSEYASLQAPIQPLRLLVPSSYPNSSPIFLDKFPTESSKENEDFSEKARSKLSISLRGLSEPVSLKDIAKSWEKCAREVIIEYAEKRGGGTFSSKYGTWNNCLF